ncbi:unnamed protein product, partial [Ectocarpus sp. 12 AP-2014]
DVSNQTATECHKLYAVGRAGMDLNLRVSGRDTHARGTELKRDDDEVGMPGHPGLPDGLLPAAGGLQG